MVQLHEAQRRADPITSYVAPESLQDALDVLDMHGASARVIAGGTDLLLELSRGARTGIHTLVDLSVLTGLDSITEHEGRIKLGPLVTHADVVASPLITKTGLPLAQACLEVGGPQLRNRATVVGNIVTASPANDTISALYALGAEVTVTSAAAGSRTIAITDFFTGFRNIALDPSELVTEISFEALSELRRGVFVKLGLRRAQAISVVHAAVVSTVTAVVNGVERCAVNAAGRTLLDWLRADLQLTGTKEGCAEGECGACTVHLDGQAVLSCLVPAARADGAEITTVEGVASPDGQLHPVQQALADCGGVQCGFCTPGFVMSATMLAAEDSDLSRKQLVHGLSGNLCRCTGYYSIIDALAEATTTDSARSFAAREATAHPSRP